MNVNAAFVTSAAAPADFPADRLPEIALVGRSNVGKSSLLNALVRQRIARTSSTPGKTRLVNVYRVARGAIGPLYLVDLPGYGYAAGGSAAAREFEELTSGYFGRVIQAASPEHSIAALLLVDARHPGLRSDIDAWRWLEATLGSGAAIAATKIDKLARGERIRALDAFESVFQRPVLPVSADTGEGLEELWKLIDRLAKNNRPNPPSRSRPLPKRLPLREPKAETAPRRRKS